MNITCAILHNDPKTVEKLETYIEKTPFLTLCGKYEHTGDALSAYYEHHVRLFFIGITYNDHERYGFCQLLNTYTRIIFVSADSRSAADCFRLDALDFLPDTVSFPVFLEAANKALRWFNIRSTTNQLPVKAHADEAPFIYIKSEYRILRLELNDILYIEGLGDYVKIFCNNEAKPILSLCSLKSLEAVLPERDFMRVHRSYIVRKKCINVLERGNIIFGKTIIPVGNSYRKNFQEYISHLPIV